MNSVGSILVFGATGSCGQAIVERGLKRGYQITAYVRNLEKASNSLDTSSENLRLVEGSLGDIDRITRLVEEHDVVASCLSSFEPPHDGMSKLTRCIVQAAESSNRTNLRFIAYSLCGVEPDGDWVSHSIQGALGIFSPGKFGPAIADHKQVIRILQSSSLNYTLFQTATMVNKPMGTSYRCGSPEDVPGVRLWDQWGVLDAADVCLDAIHRADLRRLQMQYLPVSRP